MKLIVTSLIFISLMIYISWRNCPNTIDPGNETVKEDFREAISTFADDSTELDSLYIPDWLN